jgi:hypothetical protein
MILAAVVIINNGQLQTEPDSSRISPGLAATVPLMIKNIVAGTVKTLSVAEIFIGIGGLRPKVPGGGWIMPWNLWQKTKPVLR